MENIINQVKNNWSKDLTIRFLYIKLAPYFQRDLLYFLASDEEKEAQYSQGFINRFPHIVCYTLADFYVDLFKQFGINAKKIIANSAKIPLFAILVEGDLGWYFLDPLSDLFSNQYGVKPYCFGIIPRYKTTCTNYPEIIKLPKEYIKELDETLNISYHDDYFKYLHQILTNRLDAKKFFGIEPEVTTDLREKKVQFYNEKLINLGNVNGQFERAQLYQYLNDRILNRTEKKYTRVKLVGEKENPHISFEIITKEENILYEEEKQNGVYVLTKKS